MGSNLIECAEPLDELNKLIAEFYPLLLGGGFDKDKCANKIKISGNYNETVTQMEYSNMLSVYHSQWINSKNKGSISFKLDVSKIQHFGNIILGFVTNDSIVNDAFVFSLDEPHYAICLDGEQFTYAEDKNVQTIDTSFTTQPSSQVLLQLNLSQANIMITVDDQQIIPFKNILIRDDIKYKFGVGFWVSDDCEAVTLLAVEDNTFAY